MDDAFPESPTTFQNPASPPPETISVCSACRNELTKVPTAARFCPWCGAKFPEPTAEGNVNDSTEIAIASLPLIGPFTGGIWPRIRTLCHALYAMEMGHIIPPNLPRADIRTGYSNALFRLGWRYENGMGTFRNAREAVRCYFKSAKLGNRGAAERLAVVVRPAEAVSEKS